MPAPKSLTDHVHHQTFRSRRHHVLLAGSVVPWPALAELQARYVAAASEHERRAVGVQFERAVRDLGADETTAVDDEISRRLLDVLALGPTMVDARAGRRATERFARALQAEWRHLYGHNIASIAMNLNVTPATVRRDLAYLARWRSAGTAA